MACCTGSWSGRGWGRRRTWIQDAAAVRRAVGLVFAIIGVVGYVAALT